MKKAFLFLALATLLLQAIKVEAQIGFYVGYTPQALTQTYTKVADDVYTIRFHGFYGGIHYDFDIFGDFDLTVAAQIRLNSSSRTEDVYNIQDWQFLADVPLLLNYGFTIGDDIVLGPFVGPMFSYGISYRQKETDVVTNEVHTSTDRYGTEVPAYALKRFEVAVMGGMFFEFRDFMIYGGYRFGLNDLDIMDDFVTKPRGFFVGIGIN